MIVQQSAAVAHFLPTPQGARLAALEWWQTEPLAELRALLATSWGDTLRALASDHMGPLHASPRCMLCAADADPTFAALVLWLKRRDDGTFHPEQGAHSRWVCLACGKHSHAPERTPLSAHAALSALEATQRRAPTFFGSTFLPETHAHG